MKAIFANRLHHFVFALIFFLIFQGLSAQSTFQKLYGGDWEERCEAGMKLSNGDILLTGETRTFGVSGSFQSDFYAVRINSVSGDTVWSRTFGGNWSEIAYGATEDRNGNIILGGNARTSTFVSGSYDFYVVKMNTDGDTAWTRTYGGASSETIQDLDTCQDGGYILAGTTASFGAGSNDIYLIKIDSSGDTLWTRTYGSANNDNVTDITTTSDSGFIVTGYSTAYGEGLNDVLILRLDENGDTLWTKAYGDINEENGYHIYENSDGTFMLTGYTKSYDSENKMMITKLSSTGGVVWSKYYGTTGESVHGYFIQEDLVNGGYIAGGNHMINGEYDLFLMHLNSTGDINWVRSYGSVGNSEFNGFVGGTTDDGGFFVAGNMWIMDQVNFIVDFYLVKTDNQGRSMSCFEREYHDFNSFNTTMVSSFAPVSIGYGACTVKMPPTLVAEPASIITNTPVITSTVGTLVASNNMPNGMAWIESSSGGLSPYSYEWSLIGSRTGEVVDSLYSGSYGLLTTDSYGCLDTTNFTVGEVSGGVSTFMKALGKASAESDKKIIKSKDGNYFVLFSSSSISPNTEVLAKMDPSGNMLWAKAYGNSNSEGLFDIDEDNSGNIYLAGYTNSGPVGGYDGVVLKLDANGDTIWTRFFGGGNNELMYCVVETGDGGCIVGGSTQTYTQGGQDIYLVKFDASGNITWTRSMGQGSSDVVRDIIEISSGGYMAVGNRLPQPSTPNYEIFAIRLDANGDTLWTQDYGGTGTDEGHSVFETSDGDFIICGHTSSFGVDNWDAIAMKIDIDGNVIWATTMGDESTDQSPGGGVATDDGGVILTGRFYDGSINRYRHGVVRLKQDGTELWSRRYGGINNTETGGSIVNAGNNSFISIGTTQNFGSGSNDILIVKMDGNGHSGECHEDTMGIDIIAQTPTLSETGMSLSSGGSAVSTDFTVNTPTFIDFSLNLTASANVYDELCDGSGDGAIAVQVEGGKATYSHRWNNGMSGDSISGLAPGIYTDTIEDVYGCQLIFTADTLDSPEALQVTVSPSALTCYNDSTGSITTTVSGGTPPYQYSWSGVPETTASLSGLAAGHYILDITDDNGCMLQDTTGKVTQPDSLSLDLSPTHVLCKGGNSGAVNLTVSGGTGPFKYDWSTSATTEDIIALSIGWYSVRVDDDHGCQRVDSIEITEPKKLIATIEKTDVSCKGACDGIAVAIPVGGTPPYTYTWNTTPVQSDSTATGLCPAVNYNVDIADANNCAVTPSVTILEPEKLTSLVASTDNSCGKSDGTVTVSASGGTRPYSYSWTSGGNDSLETGLTDGEYVVTVIDSNGCTLKDTATVEETPGFPTDIQGSDVSCFGGNDGGADLIISGGTSPYTKIWSNGSNSEDLTALKADTYTVVVIDAKSCIAYDTVIVGEPAELLLQLEAQHVSCKGGSDGSINLTVTGGTPGYNYIWSNGKSTKDLNNLSVQQYKVTVLDQSGCIQVDSVEITEPDPLTASIFKTDALCADSCNGTATALPSGGTPPYTYQWNTTPSQSDSIAAGLCTGNYTVNISDSKGCQVTPTVTINEPLPLTASVMVTDATCGNTDGSATITPSGGTSPYSYNWSSGGTENTETGIGIGTYIVGVKDTNQCEITDTVKIGTLATPIELCIISVDSTSSKNVLFWERPFGTSIDSFRIYRDFAGAGYQQIGSVHYDSLTSFIDNTNGIDPNITSYRYKISTVDTCGNESVLSNYHETIHLQVTPVGGSVQLSWDNYEGFNFNYYRILRDSTGNGEFEVIDSVTNANTSYTDLSPPKTAVIAYLVEVVKNAACNPSKNVRASVSTSRSNLKKTTISTLKSPVAAFNAGTTTIKEGESVDFFDESQGIVDSWKWTFTGGVPGTSTARHPNSIIYNNTGCFDVKLVVSNTAGKDSVAATCYITVSPVDGIIPFTDTEKIKIYPNPSKGVVQFDLEGMENQNIIKIYNVSGEVIHTTNTTGSSGSIDLSDKSPGFYIFEIRSTDRLFTKKVIIQR